MGGGLLLGGGIIFQSRLAAMVRSKRGHMEVPKEPSCVRVPGRDVCDGVLNCRPLRSKVSLNP